MSLHISNSRRQLCGLIFISLLVIVPLLSLHGISISSASSGSLLAIDGSDVASSHTSINSSVPTVSFATTSISTANSPDLIFIVGSIFDNGTTSAIPTPSDHSHLNWQERRVGTINFASYNAQLFEFYAVANMPLSGDRINVSLSQPEVGLSYKVFGVTGYNTTSPFDSSLQISAFTQEGNNANPTISVSTANPNDMIIGMAYIAGSPTVTPGNGFSCVGKANSCGSFGTNPVAFVEYQVVSSPQSTLLVSSSLTNTTGSPIREKWVMSADAVEGLPAPTTTTTTTTSTTSPTSTTTTSSTSTTTSFSVPPSTTTTTSSTSTTAPSTTSSHQGSNNSGISLTLAGIVAGVVIAGAVGASLYIRRRPSSS